MLKEDRHHSFRIVSVCLAYTAKIHGIIKSWQCYGVHGGYNGVVLKVLVDEWINPLKSFTACTGETKSGLV